MTCRIAWGGRFADTPEGGIAVLHDFVPTDGQDDVPRSEGYRSDAVAYHVQSMQLPVEGDGIRAGQEQVA